MTYSINKWSEQTTGYPRGARLGHRPFVVVYEEPKQVGDAFADRGWKYQSVTTTTVKSDTGFDWSLLHVVSTGDEVVPRAVPAVKKALDTRSIPEKLGAIKRLTGYQWDRVGDLIGCTRQAINKWNNGGPVSDGNMDRVARLLDAVEHIDRGNQTETRTVMEAENRAVFELLVNEEFQAAKSLAGRGPGRATASWGKVEAKPSGRLDHWTDRVAASRDKALEGEGFLPVKVVDEMDFGN